MDETITVMSTKNYQLFQEVSAGGVPVIIENGQAKFVAIDRTVVKDTSLPKGHQEPNESLQDTAIREVREETGLEAKPVEYLGKFTYQTKSDQKQRKAFVTVHWFLMLAEPGQETKTGNETKLVRILPMDTDLNILSYPNHRMFVERARKKIKKYLPK